MTWEVTITEPAAVAALKRIYEANGPDLMEWAWKFATPGQVWDNVGRAWVLPSGRAFSALEALDKRLPKSTGFGKRPDLSPKPHYQASPFKL